MGSTKPQKPYSQLSKSARFYRNNPKSREHHRKESSRISLRAPEKKRKAQRDEHNYDHDKKHGKSAREGKDISHTKSGLRYKDSSANRGSKSDSAGDARSRG